MKASVTVSLVPEARASGPFIFWDHLDDAFEQAANLGFDGIEIFPPSADALDPERVQSLMRKHNLAVAALGTGAGWVRQKLSLTSSDPENRARAVEFVQSIIRMAGKLKTASGEAPRVIIGSMQGRVENSREQTLDYLGTALRELGKYCAGHGVLLLYEFLNRYETNIFNRVADTADFLASVDSDHVKILADLFHMNIEEASLPEAIRAGGSKIGHIHFVDSNRRAAGFGHTNFEPIFSALREIKYEGYLSAEALPWPTPEEAAKQTICAFRKLAQQ